MLGSEEDRPLFDAPPLPAEELEKLLEDGADIIMEIVPAIHEFWRNHQG